MTAVPAGSNAARLPGRFARLVGGPLGAPFRFYRRRIYAQLIVSHVLVALLMAVLLTVAAFGLILGLVIPNAAPPLVSQAGVTEQARLLGHLITADDVARLDAGDTRSTAAYVQQVLARIVAAGQPNEVPLAVPSTQGDLAIVTDPSGIVLGSSNPAAVPTGRPIDAVHAPLLAAALARYNATQGGSSIRRDPFASRSASGFRAVAYAIQTSTGQDAGIVILQRADIPPISFMRPPRLATALAGLSALAILLFTLPAIVLAAPFGAWRARRVARRLVGLAAAADDMARGHLGRRLAGAGEDEIGRLGERFNAMAASLDAADRQRRSFVANISHELRTPVAIAQGNVEGLLQARHDGGEPPEELRVIQRETATLARLIDDLFTLARLDEAVLPVTPVPTDLARVASEVIDGIRGPAWDQRRVVVRSLAPAGLPAVLADPTRLRQILGNLVQNALRYTPEGGVVVVDARREADQLAISVTDTGVGIPPNEIDQVFQRFYRGTQQRVGEDAGGLGLAIVKQLVEAQGGTISVESQPGHGTTFRFTLPLARIPA